VTYPGTFHRELLDVTDADAVREVVDHSFRCLSSTGVMSQDIGMT
jgi:hypothetical protein